MQYSRYIFFILVLILGAALGLYYGWVLSPVELVNTTPSTLRIDYQADYVLMVAESFSVDQNPNLAICRLALLGGLPQEAIDEALIFGVEQGYTPEDMVLMRDLAEALESWQPNLEDCE